MDEGTDSEYDGPTDDSDDHSIGRREYLKLAGTATALAATAATQSVAVSATSHGYGEGGYGQGAYGGSSTFSVTSTEATAVEATSATLNGSLASLDDAESADCSFEYREVGTSDWASTSAQTLTATGSFSADVSGLSSGTDYEFRSVASASDGDTDSGTAVQFTTGTSTGSTGPSIDSYEASEAGAPGPNAEITADWSVSDADGDLDTVVVRVMGTDNTLADAAVTDVSGSSASGSDTVDVRNVDGVTFVVVLTVVDTNGQSVSETKFVTE